MATAATQPYLLPADSAPRPAASYERICTDDVTEAVHACRRLVERAGLEVLVLDRSRPDVGSPVAKALALGLRHSWTRLAPGRVHGVPLRLDRPEPPPTRK